MSTVWKLVGAIIIIGAVYFGYQNFSKTDTPATEALPATQSMSHERKEKPTAAVPATEGNNASFRDAKPEKDVGAKLAELEALARTEEEKEKIEEEISLNEETGELIVKNPVTGEIVFQTIIEPELIPLTKQNLELDFVTDIPDDLNLPPKEEAVSVYPPESSGQVPEQVIINNNGQYEVIDVPDDSKALDFIESIPDDQDDNHL